MASNSKVDYMTEDVQVDETQAQESQAHSQTGLARADESQPKDTQVEKAQPWKAGWIARNKDDVEKPETKGLSHGTEKGDDMIIGGFTSGVAVRVAPTKSECKS
ncbi:hypothetical protein ACHAQJ_003319 [Trichoderma viride]